MTLIAATMIGCSKSDEAIKNDFKTKLYGSSKDWSSIEWKNCNTEVTGDFDVNAVYSDGGDPILFNARLVGKKTDLFFIVAKTKPSAADPDGKILGLWNHLGESDFYVSGGFSGVPKGSLSRAAEDMATFLYKSVP